MASPPHISWLKDTGQTLSTAKGEKVQILEFNHTSDKTILSGWAKHFREHYCFDEVLDEACEGTGLSRKDYLTQLVFPDKAAAPGPSTRVCIQKGQSSSQIRNSMTCVTGNGTDGGGIPIASKTMPKRLTSISAAIRSGPFTQIRPACIGTSAYCL